MVMLYFIAFKIYYSIFEVCIYHQVIEVRMLKTLYQSLPATHKAEGIIFTV